MVLQVQHVRHATATADAYTGIEGELTVDLSRTELRLHDGLTAGGIRVARQDLSNIDVTKLFMDAAELVVNDGGSASYNFRVETDTNANAFLIDSSSDTISLNVPVIFGSTVTGLTVGSSLTFEGATADAFETAFTVVDPTADRTFTIPDADVTILAYADTYLNTASELAFQQAVNLEIGVDVMAYDSTMLVDADIGSSVQAYSAALDAVSGTNTGDEVAATTTVAGVVELSTSAENVAGVAVTSPSVAGVKEMIDTHSPGIALGTAAATTSGTSFNFGSIPAGTKRITLSFSGVSLSGTDELLVQIGDAVGIESTGYNSTSVQTNGLGTGASTSSTSGFVVTANATGIFSGQLNLTLLNSSTFAWAESHCGKSGTGTVMVGGGDKALSAELTQLTLAATGADTFDAGEINIQYE